MISRGIGYIDIPLDTKDCFIDQKWLQKQKAFNELKFVKHVHLSVPLLVKLDGRSGRALILKSEKTK